MCFSLWVLSIFCAFLILLIFYAEWDTGWVGGPEVILEVHETMTNSPNPIVVNETSIPTGNFSSFYCEFSLCICTAN